MAKGFCTCERDFPGQYPVPWNATWHYLCDRPILRCAHCLNDPPAGRTCPTCGRQSRRMVRATGTGWPGGRR